MVDLTPILIGCVLFGSIIALVIWAQNKADLADEVKAERMLARRDAWYVSIDPANDINIVFGRGAYVVKMSRAEAFTLSETLRSAVQKAEQKAEQKARE